MKGERCPRDAVSPWRWDPRGCAWPRVRNRGPESQRWERVFGVGDVHGALQSFRFWNKWQKVSLGGWWIGDRAARARLCASAPVMGLRAFPLQPRSPSSASVEAALPYLTGSLKA